MDFIQAIEHRRSVYALSADSQVSNERVLEIVRTAIDHAPSPWNGQEQRAIVLFGDAHRKLWDIVEETLLERVSDVQSMQFAG